MRRSFVVLLPLVLAASSAGAQSATFASLTGRTGLAVRRFDVDGAHSAVEFTARFMGLSNVRGAFGDFGGTVMVDTVDATRSSVSFAIRTASINTNSAMRDKDLRSENFFDAEKYPLITFRSTAVARAKGGFVARGPLTMHGVTREVAIPFTQLHPLQKDAWGNLRMGFHGTLRLNRHDFGIEGTKFWNSEYDPGRMSIGDSVDVELTISARLNNVEKWTAPRADSLAAAMAAEGAAPVLARLRAAAADSTTPLGRARGQLLGNAGVKLMHRGRYDDAAAAYALLAEWSPDAPTLAALGEAYLMAGKRDLARASFERALVADSTNTVAAEYLRHLGAARG